MSNYLKKIFFLSGESKSKFFFIFFCYLISSFFDVIGIALVGSFVTIIIKPDIFNDYDLVNRFEFLNIPLAELSFFLGISIIFIFIFKTFLIVFVYKHIINFCFDIQSSLRNKLMQSYLSMNYENYTQEQTSKYIQISGNMVKTYGSVLNAFLQTTGDFIIFLSISFFLIYVNFQIYLMLIIFFFLFFIIYKKIFLDKLKNVGEQLNKNYTRLYKNIRDFFHGFKEIKILNVSNIFFTNVKDSSKNIANYDKKNAFITIMPKYLLELFFVIFIIVIFLVAVKIEVKDSIIISTSSFFVASTIRILPSLLQFVRLKSTFNLGENSINILFTEIKNIEKINIDVSNKNFKLDNENKKFEKLEFINVDFKYINSDKLVLKNINLSIEKNRIYGIKGLSGSGKTTMIDLMMGLLKPSNGIIKLNDNIDLDQKHMKIAYISQKTFLLNDTILKNIALTDNIHDISYEDFKKALNLANIDSFVDSLPNQHFSNVGEDGVKVSGGQRQRIALARSFFFNKDIIFLDEPTSALDDKNTKEIMNQLDYLKKTKTIIITSHSDSVLAHCDKVFSLEQNTLKTK